MQKGKADHHHFILYYTLSCPIDGVLHATQLMDEEVTCLTDS